MSKSYLKIGSYTPETEDTEAVIDRGYYRQGWIVKDEEAFRIHPDRVCYVPELSDTAYTREDYMGLCNEQEKFAAECFYAVDWQHPETWIDEQYKYDEWGRCERCQQIYDMGGEPCPCPICGTPPEGDEGEQDGDTKGRGCSAEPGGI